MDFGLEKALHLNSLLSYCTEIEDKEIDDKSIEQECFRIHFHINSQILRQFNIFDDLKKI